MLLSADSVLIPFMSIQFGPRSFHNKQGIAFRVPEKRVVASVDTVAICIHRPSRFGMNAIQPNEFGFEPLANGTIHPMILRHTLLGRFSYRYCLSRERKFHARAPWPRRR